MDKGIWVTGLGTATGQRDECVLTVGAEVRRPSAAAALSASAEALERMRAALLAGGVEESALATSAVSLNPMYDDYPTVAGFQAAVHLTATTTDLAAVGALLRDVVVAGGDDARLQGVSFGHRDTSALLVSARAAAWADAATRAGQLAGLAGRELGDVLAIDETVSSARPPGPMVRATAMSDPGGPARMSMDAGEGSVVVSLTVGWSLR
ncbi:MAG: SIMPL domain-containing protein [Candidatus Nanopelagicales bacterium]